MSRQQIDQKEMPFLDHLEELRWRLIKSLSSIFILTVICFIFSDYLLDILLYPGYKSEEPINLQVLKVQTVFMIKLEIALVTGIILSLPVIVYQIWMFITPGLLDKERGFLPVIVLSTFFFFVFGAVLAYFIIIPLALDFFLSLAPTDIENNIALDFYISFILRLMVVFGIIFELPMLSFILTKLGLLTPAFMRRYRRYAIVIAFIFGAILTPPDPTTQLFLAVPLVLLYEVSIFICYWFAPKQS